MSPINNIFGVNCEKLSITPVVPKSGEQEDHTAPRTEVLIYAITVSGIFGKYAATRSPFFIQLDFIQFETWVTFKFKLFKDKAVLYPFSLLNIIDFF